MSATYDFTRLNALSFVPTVLHPVLSSAAVSIFLQLCFNPAIPISGSLCGDLTFSHKGASQTYQSEYIVKVLPRPVVHTSSLTPSAPSSASAPFLMLVRQHGTDCLKTFAQNLIANFRDLVKTHNFNSTFKDQ